MMKRLRLMLIGLLAGLLILHSMPLVEVRAETGSIAGTAAVTEATPYLNVDSSQIVLALGEMQRWVFHKDSDELWGFSTVDMQGDGGGWHTLFDNGGPFILGDNYHVKAEAYTVLENTPEHVSIQFAGTGSDGGNNYDWTFQLEAREGQDWIKRTFQLIYEQDGVVHPEFTLLSSAGIGERSIATYSPKNTDDQPFDIGLPLILGRLETAGPIADVAILMNNGTLSPVGQWASIKSRDGVSIVGPNAGIRGAAVEAGAVQTVESFFYIRNGSDSSFGKLAKTATDAYWELFTYPSEMIGYPLTAGIPSWEDAASPLLDYFGNDTTASSDHTFMNSQGVGWYMPYSDSDMPGIKFADGWGASGVSRGALTYAATSGKSLLFDNVKTLTDNFIHGGFIISDQSNDDGWHHQFFDENGFVAWQGLDSQMTYTNPNYMYDPIISAYMMYKVTGDEDYRDGFRRMVEFLRRNFSLDQTHYSQPAGYKVQGEEGAYEPYGGELGEQGLVSGGGAAAYALTMLYAAKEFDDPVYRELGLNTVKHMIETRYDQMYGIRTTPKNESFAYAIRALVEAYEAGLSAEYLDDAEEYAAQMLLQYFFYNYTWDNDGAYNEHPTVGLARADTIERQIAFREAAESLWYASSILKYREPDTLLKMMAMARQNQLWFISKNDEYLGYGVNAYPDYLPYEFILQDRVAPREIYGAGDVFMMYMLFEAFATSSDDQVVIISPTAVEEYRTDDHIFVLYNTSTQTKTVDFKLQNMTDGTYHIIRNGELDSQSHEYADLSTVGLSVQIPAESSYRIRAVRTESSPQPQAQPAPAATVVGDDMSQLIWQPESPEHVDYYEIFRSTDPAFAPDRHTNLVGESRRSTFTDLGLQPSTTYFYKIKAVSLNGETSAASPASSGITTTAATAPGAITGLKHETMADRSLSYRWIKLAWDARQELDFAKYYIYRSVPGSPETEIRVGESTVNRFIDDEVDAGATYAYRVTAVDRLGHEGPSSAPVVMSSAFAGFAAAGDEFISDEQWSAYSGEYLIQDGQAVVTENGSDVYGYIGKSFSVDLDNNPYVAIKVDSVDQQWALKVNSGGADIDLQPPTSEDGVHLYNLRGVTGWSGQQTFTIKLFTVGEQAETSFDWVRFTPFYDEMDSARLWQEESAGLTWNNEGSITATQSNPLMWESNIFSRMTANLDVNTHLSIKVADASGRWSIKVNDGIEELTIQLPTNETGEFVYDLRELTRWSGAKTFNLKLYAVDPGAEVTIDWVRNGPYHDSFSRVTEAVLTQREDFASMAGWHSFSANMSLVNGGAVIGENSSEGDEGYAAKTYYVHLDESPYLNIDVRSVSGQWALEADKGDGSPPVMLQHAINESGKYVYNVKQLTGWSGSSAFSIRLHAIGEGSEVDVHSLSFGAYDEAFHNAERWTDENSSLTTDGGKGKISLQVANPHYGSVISDAVYADLNATPYLRVKVDNVTDLWALKVNDGGADIDVQQEIGQTGVFTYDLRQFTGWSGKKEFSIRIYAVGHDSEIELDWLHLSQERSWKSGGAQSLVIDGDHLTIEQIDKNVPWGILTRDVRVDLSTHPLLELDITYITATNGYWALRVSKGSETKQLQFDYPDRRSNVRR